MPITVDSSRLPILVVTFEGSASDAEFVDYLAQLTRNLQRRQKTAVVLDATRGSSVSTAQRRLQADWMRDHRQELIAWSVGSAFCFSSPVFRFVLSSIFLIQPIPTPYQVCATLEEGLAWAQAQLRAASR